MGPLTADKFKPRPYQQEALEALDEHVIAKDTNPCVVIPTGGGKSLLIAWAIQAWKRDYPAFRVVILAHRKELVVQNANELRELWPFGDIGLYSAALKQKDTEASIIFASIDSIYKKWGEIEPFDVVIIDEAHRIPARGEGKYRSFIKGCRYQNPNVRIVGFTATPFRMGCGPICHEDHILHEVCYEANIGKLIDDGYLCKLRSKIGESPDMAEVKRNSGGDYTLKSLSSAVDVPKVVQKAVNSAVKIMNAEDRKSVVFFCVDVEHCKHVSTELRKYGINAPYVTAKTSHDKRDQIVRGFINGSYRAICNVNVYTEGFNAKRVDCIVLLRPTLSRGLFVQMVGRGLRLHPDKSDCLVLDYAHCIEEHGPIDCLDAGEVKLADCKNCGDTFSRAIRTCPNCGWTIPKKEIERLEAAEAREKRLHTDKLSQANILGSDPYDLVVDSVTVHCHRKPGKPDSLRVSYHCGLAVVNEWVCLDHKGYAESIARRWWARRFNNWRTITVDEALHDLFLPTQLAQITEGLTVKRVGKFYEIVSHKLRNERKKEAI